MRFYLLALTLLAFTFCNNSDGNDSSSNSGNDSEKPFSLKLKVNGFSNAQIKLMGFYADQNYIVDSVQADAQGNAAFNHDTAIAAGMYFLVFPDNAFAQMLIDEDQQFTLEFDKADPVRTMKVQGSLNNELLYKNLKFEADISKKFEDVQKKLDAAPKDSEAHRQAQKEQNDLLAERKKHLQWFQQNHPNAFFTKFKIAGQNPDLKDVDEELKVYLYRNEFWNGVDFSDERLLRTPVYYNKLKRFMKELTPQIPDSLIKYADYVTQKSMANKELFKFTANWIALQYQKTKIMGLEAVYAHMIDKYWTPDLAWWSNKEEIEGLRKEVNLMKPSLIGQTGQDLRAKNEKGEYISLYDLKTPIKVLYIFSYECENCQKETPKLLKVYHDWKNKGVDVFTLSIDADRAEWQKYLQKNNMHVLHNIFDFDRESQYHRKYHIDVTPEIYVLGKDNKIIASNIDSEQLPAIFERELAKN